MKKSTLLYIALLAFSFSSVSVHAQRKRKNSPNYNDKRIHFGFSLGLNFYDFHIQETADLTSVPGFYRATPVTSPGYNVNIVSNLRLAKYLDFRFLPGFASTNRVIEFDVINPITNDREIVSRDIVSSFFEFPFELKYRSKRVGNYGLHVTSGFKYNWDVSSQQDVDDDRIFKLRQNDFLYELGFGIDMYFEFFKFSPQIKASFGLNDIMVQDGTFLVEGINRLETRSILINFTFE